MEFQETEIVTLVVAVAFLLSVAFLHKVIRLPRLPLLLYAAIFTLMGGHLFTVVEGLFPLEGFWYGFFNVLEHSCYAVSGILFAVGCWALARKARRERA
ncbi:MAG TPA: hypothetical protein VM031_07045 [Phycisphaerae bacterium]|nr:hypothetical protein [Phycisphaerae bacterium]